MMMRIDQSRIYKFITGNTPIDRQMEAASLLGIRYHAGRGTPPESYCPHFLAAYLFHGLHDIEFPKDWLLPSAGQ